MTTKRYTAEVTHYCGGSMSEHEYEEDIEVESDALMAWLNCPRCGAEGLVSIVQDAEYDQGFLYAFDPE
jgi:formate dehydrogenase maturation protein FdhE